MTKFTGLLSLFLLLVIGTSSAQINVIEAGASSFSPEELISNVFLGEGVTVTSITYKGKAAQVGYFNGASADIGIDRGIVMTTGSAEKLVGPESEFVSTETGSTANDADLAIIGNNISPDAGLNDVAIYEISFIPVADTLRFKYVFSSEEYPEYVCTQFNDVFGFFINGPGISGSFSNNSKNIALIPDPSDPSGLTFPANPTFADYVAISNVNNGNPGDATCAPKFPMYYNDNTGGLNLAYDGFTNVFTAQAIVVPCEEYHIRLVIADLGDESFDTGVFLEAKSFGTGSVLSDLQTVSVDGTIVEGCSGATVQFTTPNELDSDLTLTYKIVGNATFPTDYTITKDGTAFNPNDPLVIVAGDTSVTLEITAIADGLAENGEAIGISIQKDVCTLDTLFIPIKDNILVDPQLPADTSICSGNNASIIQLNGDLGLPEPEAPSFTYIGNDKISNDLSNVNASLNVIGVQPPFLAEGVIRSVCVKIDHKYNDDLDIFLLSPNNTPVLLSSDNGFNSRNMEVCFTESGPNVTTILDYLKTQFPPNGEVDFPNINNLYFTGIFSPEGSFSDYWSGGAESPTNGKWRLLVYDDTGSSFGDGAEGKLLEWSITFEPLFKLTYEWDASPDLSCLDCPVPDLTIPNQTTTYHLTVHDTYGCSVEDSYTVLVQDSLDAPIIDCQIVGKDNITFGWLAVAGANTYEVNIDGAGWIPVGTDLFYDVTGLALNQTVQIQVRAIGDCPAKIGTHECTSLDCTEPTYSEALTPVKCVGNIDGQIILTLTSNPKAPYSFELNGITNTTGTFSNLAVGAHQIVITDGIGCNYTYDFNIGEPTELLANAIETQMVNCFGGQTGAGTITASGGTEPYAFTLNGGTDANLTNVAAGTYPYIVTDDQGCTAAGDLIISQNEPIAFEQMALDPNCFDSADGKITIFNITGGSPDYSFLWDDSQNQSTIAANNLSAGTYAVTVTDQLGCTATAENIELTSPTEITATVDKVDAICGGDPGSAIITVEGGAGTYTYNWSDIGLSGNKRTDLDADTYQVTITDMSDCAKVIDIDILSASDIELKVTSTDVDCFGNDNGSATVNVESGGNAPFTYQWNDPLNQTDKAATNLPAGEYKIIVTDNTQCVAIETVKILEPEELQVDTTLHHIDCFGASKGNIATTVTGGTMPYTFTYTLPDNTTASTENLNDIPAGTYLLNVTDANNCQVNLIIIINEPAPVSLAFANSDPICYVASDGFTQVNVMGGTLPYTYTWSTNETTQAINNLSADTYGVTVTDGAGCVYDAETIITEHEEILATITQTSALCRDDATGSAVVQEVLLGGSSQAKTNYNFTWNTTPSQTTFDAYQLLGGASYEVVIEDNVTGCSATHSIEIDNPAALTGKVTALTGVTCKGRADGQAEIVGVGGTPSYTYQWEANANNQTGAIATNLPKGTYRATIEDVNGCQSEIEIEIDEPNAIEITLAIEDVKCSGDATGTIRASVVGGEAPYQYAWDMGQTTNELNGLVAGNYNLTVTDTRGCTESQGDEIAEPSESLLGSTETKDITCNGGRNGQILIAPTGGTAPYRYSLNGEPFSPNPNKVGLYPGNYEVIIQDVRGCLDTLPIDNINEPEAIIVDLGPNLNISYGDTIQLNTDVQNAFGNTTYQWTTGSGASISCTDCASPFAYPSFQEYFYVAVRDENGCTGEAKILFNVNKTTQIFVPTGFSPNDDGLHDKLFVLGEEDVILESFSIFDRWGEKVYEVKDFTTNDATSGWAGTFRGENLPSGQYAWQLKAIMADGRIEFLQGLSTLIR